MRFAFQKSSPRVFCNGWFVYLALFRRPHVELGEFSHRFNLTVGVGRDDIDRVTQLFRWRWVWDCVTVPAWLDEPTVVVEDAANQSRLRYHRFGHRGLA